jgi:hypothetical protein
MTLPVKEDVAPLSRDERGVSRRRVCQGPIHFISGTSMES